MRYMSKVTTITFAASDAKNNFGRLIDAAQRRPVSIERRGRPVAFVVSPADMEAFEDARLGARAMKIMRTSKSLGVKASEAYLRKILNAKD